MMAVSFTPKEVSMKTLLFPVSLGQLTWSQSAALAWSVAWRGLIVNLVSVLISALFGGGVGVLASILDMEEALLPVSVAMGLFVGVFFQWVALRWLTNAKLGKFRLVVVHE
jgi:hypothetical protein